MYCDWPILGRCCFCLPLRKGVLAFGYFNIVYSAVMIGLYSFSIHHAGDYEASEVIFYGRMLSLAAELAIAIYCFEIVFSVFLIYGAHMKSVFHVKLYYYFSLTILLALLLLQIIDLFSGSYMAPFVLQVMSFMFAGLCVQIYQVTIVRSLLKSLETSGPHRYDNQLHTIVSGERIEANGVYNNTTLVPTEV